MEKGKEHKGQKLLRRWLSGEITASEERELDRLAQEDPFLAEALDAYRHKPEDDHLTKVGALKARFEEKKERRALPFWRIAAAIAVLVLAGIAMWQVNDRGMQDLAQMEPATEKEFLSEAEEADDLSSEAQVETEPAEEAVTSLEIKPENEATNLPPTNFRKKEAAPLPAPVIPEKKVEIAAIEEEQISDALPEAFDEQEEAVPLNTNTAIESEPGIANYEPRTAIAKEDLETKEEAGKQPESLITPTPSNAILAQDAGNSSKQLSGLVQTIEGEPLIGATVVVSGTNIGALTDFDGKFSMEVPSADPSSQLLKVSYTGFKTSNFFPDGKNIIELNPAQAALEEVVVTGLERRKAKRAAKKRDRLAAQAAEAPAPAPQPSVSNKAFDQYIEENLQYPESAQKAGVQGEVILRFSIDNNGKPNNFLMVKSLGYGCDREAMRLLREGPLWVPAGKSLAQYSIRFKLD